MTSKVNLNHSNGQNIFLFCFWQEVKGATLQIEISKAIQKSIHYDNMIWLVHLLNL